MASRDGHRSWSIAVGLLSSSWWQTGLLALSGQLSGHRGTGLISLAPLGVVAGKLVGGRGVTQSSRIRGDWQAACCSLTAPLGLWRETVPCKSVQKSGCGDVWVCAGVCRHMVCVCVCRCVCRGMLACGVVQGCAVCAVCARPHEGQDPQFPTSCTSPPSGSLGRAWARRASPRRTLEDRSSVFCQLPQAPTYSYSLTPGAREALKTAWLAEEGTGG